MDGTALKEYAGTCPIAGPQESGEGGFTVVRSRHIPVFVNMLLEGIVAHISI